MKFTNELGKKISLFFQRFSNRIIGWALKTKIIVGVASVVVVAGVANGAVIISHQLNKTQQVIADTETEEAVVVAEDTQDKRMDISIPSYLVCNVVGESIEKDLTLYIKGMDDNKIAGVPFQIKLVKTRRCYSFTGYIEYN